LFGGGVQVRLGIACGAFRLFKRAFGDRTPFKENLSTLKLYTREPFIVLGFHVGLESAGDVVAAHSEQQLALGHRIAEPGLNFYNSSGGQRNHRHGARYVRLHHAGDIQSRGCLVFDCLYQGKLVRVVHFEIVGVQVRLDGCRRRRLGLGVCLAFIAASEEQTQG